MPNVKSANVRDIYIDYLKGLAMVMIVLLHSVQMVDGLQEIIRKPILLGQIGVQLFFFCSGYLVMKSYCRNGKKAGLRDSVVFLRKKYINLAVPFVVFVVIYLTINYVYTVLQIDLPYKNSTDILSVILNVFLLHGFFPFCLNNVVPGGWYVGTLLILFVITPFIIRFTNIKKSGHMMIFSAVTALISVILSVILNHFFGVDTDNGSFFYFSFLNQSPAYFIGMSSALDEREIKGFPKSCIFRDGALLLMIAALFYFEFSFSYAVIPFLSALLFADVYRILYAVPVLVSKTKWICTVGQNTFAIYLSHFMVVWYIPLLIKKLFDINGIVLWLIILCLCVVMCMLAPIYSVPLNKLSKRIEKATLNLKRDV